MKPDVTILLAIYNVEKYIKKCLESLTAQTFRNIEIWAVSDGSPDNSMSVVEEFAKSDSRIKPIYKENGGYGSVLQYGIDHIKSEYFLVCDPDDWLPETAVEELYDCAVRTGADIVVGDKINVYDNGASEEYKSSKPSWLDNIKPETLYTDKDVIQQFSFFEVSPHSKLYRTSLLHGVKFPKKVSFSDFVLYMLALDRADSVYYHDRACACYNIERPGNSATNIKLSKINDYVIVWNCAFRQLVERHENKNEISYLFQRMAYQLLFYYIEYFKSCPKLFKDNYINKIFGANKKLLPYSDVILSRPLLNVSYSQNRRRMIRLMMNRSTYKPAVKFYLTVRSIKDRR